MRYYDHIHQINDKQPLLLLDSQNGLNVPDTTLDNDFSLWSIHTSNLLENQTRCCCFVSFACCIVSKAPPGFETMIIPGTYFNRLSRAYKRYR